MIYFIGAGPGSPDLLTLRAINVLKTADILVYASSLVSKDVLKLANEEAIIYDSAPLTLEEVLAIYRKNKDKSIARIHSGDLSIYSSINEQILWCYENGFEYEIIPGVSSMAAASALIGKELTVPNISQSIIITRLPFKTKESARSSENLSQLASHGVTMAIFLSAARPSLVQKALLTPPSSFTEDTPTAIVYKASWPQEKFTITTLGKLAQSVREMHVNRSTLILVGDVISKDGARSFLYSPDFAHRFRKRSNTQ